MSASSGNRSSQLFDGFASGYDAALNRGLRLSGECKEYFAAARVAWLRRCAGRAVEGLPTVADYGCGTGSSIPHLQAELRPLTILGLDVSEASLEEARRACGSTSVRFMRPDEGPADGSVNLVFSNGTLHHIPPPERPAAAAYVYRVLAPGGWAAIWENNPWNPGTRLVMRRIPFDRDARPISPPALRRLMHAAGFRLVHTSFLFIFPRALRRLRRLERAVCRLPLGAQYLVLARKPPRGNGGTPQPSSAGGTPVSPPAKERIPPCGHRQHGGAGTAIAR